MTTPEPPTDRPYDDPTAAVQPYVEPPIIGLPYNPHELAGAQPQEFTGTPPQGFAGTPPQGFAGAPPQEFTAAQPHGFAAAPPQDFTGAQQQGYPGAPPQEFAAAPSPYPPAPTAPQPYYPPPPAQYQQPGPYQQQPYGYPMYVQPPSTNGMAIAAMVLGILWLYWIGSILALVFGYVARDQIKKTGQSGDGMAIAGIVLGWVGIGFLVVALTGYLAWI